MNEPDSSRSSARPRFSRRLRAWLRALAAASSLLGACRSSAAERTQGWLSEGGELGTRVREGKLPGVTHHRFTSKLLGKEVGLVVATPPGYASSAGQRYPVVYVFPGIGGDEWAYLATLGLDSPALEAMFADAGKAPIVVFANPGDSGGHGEAERVLAEELVAFVDGSYRTRAEAAGRSLEGFSLGGATALTLLTRRPTVFGRAVGSSSACYLLETCGAIRKGLAERARAPGVGPVLLTIGAKENADNRAVNEELAPLFGVKLVSVPGADHDLRAQYHTRVGDQLLGQQVAAFHLAGFAR